MVFLSIRAHHFTATNLLDLSNQVTPRCDGRGVVKTTTNRNGDNNFQTRPTPDNQNYDTPERRQAIEAITVTVKTTINQNGNYNVQAVALMKRIPRARFGVSLLFPYETSPMFFTTLAVDKFSTSW